jgi:hypothetical protein
MSYRDWLKVVDEQKAARAEMLPQVWEQAGEDHYTCVAPANFPADPAVTAALHEFDPGAIIMWRVQQWKVPGHAALRTIAHVGIGRCYPDPRYARAGFFVEMPQGAKHPAPNYLDRFFEGDPIAPNGPGEVLPWDWGALAFCTRKWLRERLTVERFDAAIVRRKAREAKMRADHQAQIEYVKSWIEPWILRKIESSVSDGDWAEYQRLMAYGARRARKTGAWSPARGSRITVV